MNHINKLLDKYNRWWSQFPEKSRHSSLLDWRHEILTSGNMLFRPYTLLAKKHFSRTRSFPSAKIALLRCQMATKFKSNNFLLLSAIWLLLAFYMSLTDSSLSANEKVFILKVSIQSTVTKVRILSIKSR